MKLLKSFGEDAIEMKVVSLLDSASSMVSADTPWQEIVMRSEGGLYRALCLLPAFVTCHTLNS